MRLFSATAAGIRHAAGAAAEAALVVGVVAALVFGLAVVGGQAPAGAGDTFARGGSEIWIESSTLRSGGELRAGDSVSFGFTTGYWDYDRGTGPWMKLQCYQGGGLVLADYRPGLEGWPQYGEPFVLSSAAWPSGAADCKGLLGHRSKTAKWITEATVNFSVAP